MKKILAILMVAVMCFGLCACGSSSVYDAIDKAEDQLREFSSVTYNGYKYRGEYSADTNVYVVVMDYKTYGGSTADTIALDKMISKTASKEVYKKISKIFKKHDTTVNILMWYPDDDYIIYRANDYE